ncbi:MAG TPA: hypothetical protein VMW53_01615 [archaeon]|nr:hypothetical protein [archaeon]
MNTFFAGCTSPGEIKSRYRELAMKYHPDRGGDTRTMQDINSEYHSLLKSKHGFKWQREDGEWKEYKYNFQNEQYVVDALERLLDLELPADVEIMIIGLYIWVTGNTKPIKEELKEIQFKWHSKRQCWYWRPAWMMSNYSGQPLSVLAATYGARVVDHDSKREPEPARQETFKELKQ